MWGGGCAAHVVVRIMVENKEEFCLPHNLSYDGSYHVRHFYPRLICCRHSAQDPGMASPPGADSGGQSPASSPQRRPLLAHVEGGAVVSKIAVPPGHPPLKCSSGTGIGLRGMGLGPAGSTRGGGGGRGVGGRVGVVVQQPSPTAATASMFTTTRPPHHGTTTSTTTTSPTGSSSTNIQNGESADGNRNVTTTTTTSADSLTCSLEKYLVTVSTSQDDQNYQLLMGDGHSEGEQRDPGGGPDDHGEEGAASPVVSPDSVVDSHTRAVFRLSDVSDFSDDYTAMTDMNCSGHGESFQNGHVNGSSVCSSEVFSDRSSEQDDLASPPLSDVTGQDATSQDADDDDETPKVFPGLSEDIDSPTRKRVLLIGQGHREGHDDDIDPSEAPAVTSPDITLEEVFDLQKVTVNEDGGFYDDKEFEFLKAQPIKRSTSLKTYKTPPGTPKRKMVRFADALGLDLESVRHILNMEAPPRVPQSAMRDLKLEDSGSQQNKGAPLTQGARYLTACFPQPGINPTFPLMVRDRKVILESCVIYDHNLSVSGTVRVANIHYHKDVTIRCTTNNWLTFNDINAGYVQGSNDGPTDRFSFTISLPHYFNTGSRLQFCIRYVTGGQDYWDNNHGSNYVIECYARTMPDLDNTWTSFL